MIRGNAIHGDRGYLILLFFAVCACVLCVWLDWFLSLSKHLFCGCIFNTYFLYNLRCCISFFLYYYYYFFFSKEEEEELTSLSLSITLNPRHPVHGVRHPQSSHSLAISIVQSHKFFPIEYGQEGFQSRRPGCCWVVDLLRSYTLSSHCFFLVSCYARPFNVAMLVVAGN